MPTSERVSKTRTLRNYTIWEGLVEVTKECRLIYRIFNIGPP